SYYMPYEQAGDPQRVDGRSDIYALGATLYHLLTGEVPFPGSTHHEIVQKKALGIFRPASELNPAVPAELDRILHGRMARQPEARYATAAELTADLEACGFAANVTNFPELDYLLQEREEWARLEHLDQRTRPDFEFAPSIISNAPVRADKLQRLLDQ